MALWLHWWNAIVLLRPAFSRLRSFLWFSTAVAGLTVRPELLGVTSIVRALSLKPLFYDRLLDHFHSAAVKPDALAALWARLVLKLFPAPVRVNGRLVLVGDGIKAAKRGKKMPGVKLLHQQSDSNKAEYIMGHSLQAICILVQAAQTVFAVPLAMRIHEGIVWSNRDQRTLLDKMLALLGIVGIAEAFYFVGDAYYASGKIIKGLLEKNHHLVTRARSNAVAYRPFVRYWRGWNRPISRRWLGDHKSVVGFCSGLIVALAVTFLQSELDWRGSLLPYSRWPVLGLAFGFGALAGDSLKSLVKRWRGIPPGTSWIPMDQLAFVVGALVLASPWTSLEWPDVAWILAISFVGDVAINHLAYWLGIRDTKLWEWLTERARYANWDTARPRNDRQRLKRETARVLQARIMRVTCHQKKRTHRWLPPRRRA